MPTNRKHIEKWSLAYHLLKYYVDFCFNFYFPTTVSGLENIPKDKSIIFAPNHQNALIDALAILRAKTWQPVFLARADIFEKPLFNKILTFLKILPIYRIRDGYGNLQKNDEIFDKTMDVIRNKNGLCIMPEGNHGDKKRLRLPLKKGIARIAFQTEYASNGTIDIHIVPVGLDYTHYIRVGSSLHLRFGPPIRVKPLLAEYKKNPATAYNLLLDLLAKGLKAEIISIEDDKYYDSYKMIVDMFAPEYLKEKKIINNHGNRVEVQMLLINKLDRLKQKSPDDFLILIANALEYNMLIKKMNLEPIFFPTSFSKRIGLIPALFFALITLPLFIYSFINNLLPLSLIYIFTKKIKDTQFVSTFKFAMGLLLFPIIHAIQLTVFALIIGNLYFIIAYTLSLPLSIFFFFKWIKLIRISFRNLREVYCRLFKSDKIKRTQELKTKIGKLMWLEVNRKEEEEYLPTYLSE
jgi:1-acyl-sn-glycerol-3-phosphate acyltransferase